MIMEMTVSQVDPSDYRKDKFLKEENKYDLYVDIIRILYEFIIVPTAVFIVIFFFKLSTENNPKIFGFLIIFIFLINVGSYLNFFIKGSLVFCIFLVSIFFIDNIYKIDFLWIVKFYIASFIIFITIKYIYRDG
jgi:hypothetical protein